MDYMQQFVEQYPELASLKENIRLTVQLLVKAFTGGSKLLVCGNGGSSADSDHIVGELMKGFEMKRPLDETLANKLKEGFGERGALLAEILQQGLPAISLSAHTPLLTAISNDLGGDFIFAQQVAGYGRKGDVLLAISTSGNAQNVTDALVTARALGMVTIGLTGEPGGQMKPYCDVLINVPSKITARVQELHLPVYHLICRLVEREMFG